MNGGAKNCNQITSLILRFYFTGLRSGEDLLFLEGGHLSLHLPKLTDITGVPESLEFQENGILYTHLTPGQNNCYRNHLEPF